MGEFEAIARSRANWPEAQRQPQCESNFDRTPRRAAEDRGSHVRLSPRPLQYPPACRSRSQHRHGFNGSSPDGPRFSGLDRPPGRNVDKLLGLPFTSLMNGEGGPNSLRRALVSGTFGEGAARARESRHSSTVFPLSRHGPAGSSATAGNADRAVLYTVRRFPARIRASGDPPQHRASGMAEDVRSVARRLQPRARLEPSRRSGAGQGGAARAPRVHRGGAAAGRAPARILPPRPDPGLPAPACRARNGAESPRSRRRTAGGGPRSAAPGQGLHHGAGPRQRGPVAAERRTVRI